jgi:hypothetical protein
MKCVKSEKTGEIKRVSNEHAEELVSKGWSFIPKKEWKAFRTPVAPIPSTGLTDLEKLVAESGGLKPKKIPGKKNAYREELRKKRSQLK